MEYVPVRKARQSGTIPVSSACQDENEQLPRISEWANKNISILFIPFITYPPPFIWGSFTELGLTQCRRSGESSGCDGESSSKYWILPSAFRSFYSSC